MNKKVITYVKKSIIVFIAVILQSFGVVLFVTASWGQDPLSTMEMGLEFLTGVPMGTVDLVIEIAILLLALAIRRRLIHIGTVIYALLFGPILNLWFAVLGPVLPAADTVVSKIIYIAAGALIMSFALAFYIPINMGYNCSDILAFMIDDIVHKGYGVGLTIEGAIMFVIGVFLGATWGIGTVVATFTLGPLAELFMKFTAPVTAKLVGESPEGDAKENSDTETFMEGAVQETESKMAE